MSENRLVGQIEIPRPTKISNSTKNISVTIFPSIKYHSIPGYMSVSSAILRSVRAPRQCVSPPAFLLHWDGFCMFSRAMQQVYSAIRAMVCMCVFFLTNAVKSFWLQLYCVESVVTTVVIGCWWLNVHYWWSKVGTFCRGDVPSAEFAGTEKVDCTSQWKG